VSRRQSCPLFHVDAFSATPFAGNPAAVCLLDEPKSAEWMQRVAAEAALAATAFLVVTEPLRPMPIRWFSPSVELSLCGHGSIAAAHVAYEQALVEEDRVSFHSPAGRIEANRTNDGWIALDFPALHSSPAEIPPRLVDALGTTPTAVARNDLDLIAELAHEDDVVAVRPDFAALAEVNTRGVIVTARSSRADCDFVSRYFGPAIGIPEDAVTGSAHATLGPYWGPKLGKQELTGYQASPRGGFVRVSLGPRPDRVELAGQAVTVFAGELLWAFS
jgi:PhzF family phenazine biosynthesis protein